MFAVFERRRPGREARAHEWGERGSMMAPPLGSRRFIGRTAELAVLHECRRDIARRRGSVVLVGGPAGIGKSRLVGEFCRTIGGGRAPTLVRTECIERGGMAFEPIRAVVAGLASGADADLDGVAHDALERGTFFRSIERIVRAAAEKRSVVICIEDVHWADPATLEFLAFLGPRIATDRILLVLTYRDDEIEAQPATAAAAALARVARASTARPIALRPLDESEMFALIDSVLAAREKPPAKILRRLIARAEGNPFYAEELLKGVLEDAPAGKLPQSLDALVLERFAMLDDGERAVLQHAAILGYRFDPDLLRAILAVDEAALARALRDARERNLIVEEDQRELRFRFRHALTHEAIAGRMLEFEARPLHARVALLLESLPDASRRIGEIAYHWWKAMDPERAVAANETAGDAAMNLHAYGDAATFYERALGLASDPDVASRLYSRAGEAAAVQGDQQGAIGFFERALALELDAERFGNAGDIVRRIAGRLVYAGRETEARARLDEFLLAYRGQLTDIDALLVEGWPILIDLGGGGVRGWRIRLMASGARAAAGGKDAWGLLLLELNAHAAVGDLAAWRATLERIEPFTRTVNAYERALSLLAGALTAAYDATDGSFAHDRLRATHDFCERHGLESVQKYVYACDAFDRYLHGDVRGAQGAVHLALADPDDANQRTNMAVVGPLIGLDCDDADLLALATDEALLRALEREDCPNSTALAAAGVASRLRTLGRDDEAARVLERAVEALQTLFGAQLLLPLAARCVSTPRARERIEELFDLLYDGDRSGHATRAMVRAVFATRDRTPDHAELALGAAEGYAALEWPLLRAQALELAGDAAAARELYMRCGSLRQVRRLTRGGDAARGADALPVLPALSARERQVATAVAAGLGNVEIAARLGLSVKTIETHLSRIYARLGLRSRAQLASYMANQERVKA